MGVPSFTMAGSAGARTPLYLLGAP
jgi:hypothetical protein